MTPTLQPVACIGDNLAKLDHLAALNPYVDTLAALERASIEDPPQFIKLLRRAMHRTGHPPHLPFHGSVLMAGEFNAMAQPSSIERTLKEHCPVE
jgi:hypothetical protein